MIASVETVEESAFFVAGLSVRTINLDGQSQKDIGDLWTKFMAEGMLQEIAGRGSDDIYNVYTGYETDFTGFYTAVLGCRVNSLEDIPAGLTGVAIPAGTYEIYSLEGKFPGKVSDAWREIWNSNINRAYTADFDLYKAGAENFDETDVKIYLAVN